MLVRLMRHLSLSAVLSTQGATLDSRGIAIPSRE